MATIKLALNALTCGACIKSVTSVLSAHDKVLNVVKVDLTSAEVEVEEVSDALVNELITEIVDIGYEASVA